MAAETDFDGRRIGYAWDALGRLTELTNPLGQTIAYEHDSMGRLVAKRFDDHGVTYAYDPLGRLVHASGPGCEVRWARDLVGRVLTETINGRTLSLELDAAGRRVSRTTPDANRTSYAYDAAGRRVALDASGHVVFSAHDAVGRETTRTLGGSVTLDMQWDPVGRLASQQLAGRGEQLLMTRAWTYRADGYVTALRDSSRGDTDFVLDPSGRVTGVSARDWTESYVYDAAGNQSHAAWTSRLPAQEATGPRSISGTRLLTAGGVGYTYDDAGRTIVKRRTRLSRKPDLWRYTWDAEDRLTSVTTPDGTMWRYCYDPLGRRIAKQRLGEDGATVVEETSFVWDGYTLAQQTTVSANTPNPVTLTWEHDGLAPVSQTEHITDAATQETIDSRFFAIVTDLVGSPTELIDEDGGVAWHVRRTLWGLSAWRTDAQAYTPLRFPGQYHDPESGLHYNHHRYYDPETARYASPDPLGLRPTPNPVAYVHNPLTWDDPLGLSPYPAGDAIDDMIGRIDPDSLTMTRTVQNHLNDMTRRAVPRPDGGFHVTRSRPFMDSTILIREIMLGSRPALDPRGASGALRWDTPGAFNGSPGTWELVIDTNSNTILHFNFVGTR